MHIIGALLLTTLFSRFILSKYKIQRPNKCVRKGYNHVETSEQSNMSLLTPNTLHSMHVGSHLYSNYPCTFNMNSEISPSRTSEFADVRSGFFCFSGIDSRAQVDGRRLWDLEDVLGAGLADDRGQCFGHTLLLRFRSDLTGCRSARMGCVCIHSLYEVFYSTVSFLVVSHLITADRLHWL